MHPPPSAPTRLPRAGDLLARVRAADGGLVLPTPRGPLTLRLPRHFGPCYGVERALRLAEEAAGRHPGRRVLLGGELVHNRAVNERLEALGIATLPAEPGRFAAVTAEDVVIVPAFGLPAADLALLDERGCEVVDTTCGSVLRVWKSVRRQAARGYTAVVHGKWDHEETRATCSRAGGRWLVVRDVAQAEQVARCVAGALAPRALREELGPGCAPGLDPARDLERIALAHQTTMLARESLEVAEVLRAAYLARHGLGALERHFVPFDTICSATQERQDALGPLLAAGPDLLLVVGGWNSSNTGHLLEVALAAGVPAFHVEDAACLRSADELLHQPLRRRERAVARGWLPPAPLVVAFTAGASTPDDELEACLARLVEVSSG